MFAQLQNVPDTHLKSELVLLGAALTGLGIIASIVFGILHAVRSRNPQTTRILPSPITVEAAPRHPTDTEVSARHSAMEQRICALEAGIQDVQRVQREQIGNVHRRIDDMLSVVSRLGGVIEGVQETLRSLHTDLMSLRKK